MMFTYPIFQSQNVSKLSFVEDDVEDHHYQERDVEGRNGRCWVKVSIKFDKHPGGKYQNPRYAAQSDSHLN